jgi:hypothetical protein
MKVIAPWCWITEQKDKLIALLVSGVFEPDSQGRQDSVEIHFERLTDLNHKLAPFRSKTAHP